MHRPRPTPACSVFCVQAGVFSRSSTSSKQFYRLLLYSSSLPQVLMIVFDYQDNIPLLY